MPYFCSFIKKLFCGRTNTERNIDTIRSHFKGVNTDLTNTYLERLEYRYNLLKYKKKLFKSLRLLQFLGGFGITTMTTYNNPYFKENSDQINVVIWYVSISNNIFNIFIEKLNAYDLTTEKMKVDLLIREGKLLKDDKLDYKYYPTGDDNIEKLTYFTNCYEEIINKSPFDYLTNNVDHDNHSINESRRRRLSRVWTLPAPTPEA